MPDTTYTAGLARVIDSAAQPLVNAYNVGQQDALGTVRALLSEIPACFACGTDHASLPYRIDALRYESADTLATMLRRLLHNGGIALPTMHAVTLSGLPRYYGTEDGRHAATVALCTDCYGSAMSAVSAQQESATDCHGCAARVTYGSARLPRALASFSVNGYDAYTVDRVTVDGIESVRAAVTLGTAAYCTSCAEARFVCDGCSVVWSVTERVPDASDCRGCQETGADYGYGSARALCTSCAASDESAARHARHASRRDFVPRQTISEALDTPRAPGSVIVSTRSLGVEIEVTSESMPTLRDALVIEENGSPLWQSIGTDGSISPDFASVGYEVRGLPVGGAAAEDFFARTAAALSAAGFCGNLTTGMHMHVDHRDLSSAQVWQSYAILGALQPLYFGVIDSDRYADAYNYGNEYALPVSAGAISDALARAERGAYVSGNPSGTRYTAVNAEAHGEHGTLEIRAFGTDSLWHGDVLHAAALLAAVPDAVVRGTAAAAVLLSVAAEGIASRAGAERALDALVSDGLLTAASRTRLLSLYDGGRATIDDARGRSDGYDDESERYCGSCGSYVYATEDGCGCCYSCPDCGHSV